MIALPFVRRCVLANPVQPLRLRRGFLRPEVDAAPGAEFALPSHHAGRNPGDIRDFRTAQPEGVAHAGLLLLHGVRPPRCRPCPQCDRKDRTANPL